MFDELIVVKKKDMDALSAKAKLWLFGWILLALVLLASGFLCWSVDRLTKSILSVQRQQAEQAETIAVNSEALIRAWEVQKKMQEALVDWAEFSTEKVNIIDYNKTNKPTKGALTKRAGP